MLTPTPLALPRPLTAHENNALFAEFAARTVALSRQWQALYDARDWEGTARLRMLRGIAQSHMEALNASYPETLKEVC